MPVIALSPMWDDDKARSCMSHDYVAAVEHAGGAPMILPFINNENALRELLSRADGLILTGGADVDPARYGEEMQSCCGSISPERDSIDYKLIRIALEMKLPILAICRGMQILNCYFGGTLYQDIGEQYGKELFHPNYSIPRSDAHMMKYVTGSHLREVIGQDESWVNSRHHQAVKKLADCMAPAAYAPDGLLEAMEPKDGSPILAIQWHPESLEERLPEQKNLFAWLMREAGK